MARRLRLSKRSRARAQATASSEAQLQPTGPSELADGNVIDKALADVRDYNAKHGPEIVFQTGGTNPKDFEGTIKFGVQRGATSIELWQDYGGFPLSRTTCSSAGQRWSRRTRRPDRSPADLSLTKAP